jgi:hypothetical protein
MGGGDAQLEFSGYKVMKMGKKHNRRRLRSDSKFLPKSDGG